MVTAVVETVAPVVLAVVWLVVYLLVACVPVLVGAGVVVKILQPVHGFLSPHLGDGTPT